MLFFSWQNKLLFILIQFYDPRGSIARVLPVFHAHIPHRLCEFFSELLWGIRRLCRVFICSNFLQWGGCNYFLNSNSDWCLSPVPTPTLFQWCHICPHAQLLCALFLVGSWWQSNSNTASLASSEIYDANEASHRHKCWMQLVITSLKMPDNQIQMKTEEYSQGLQIPLVLKIEILLWEIWLWSFVCLFFKITTHLPPQTNTQYPCYWFVPTLFLFDFFL